MINKLHEKQSLDEILNEKEEMCIVKRFLDSRIRDRYNKFNDAHKPDHYDEVVKFGMDFYDKYRQSYPDVREAVLYATLALHDIGYELGTVGHDVNGAVMIREDAEVYNFLKQHLTEEEIDLVAASIAEHQGTESSNIYSMILKDADNAYLLDANRRYERMGAYNKNKYPGKSKHDIAIIIHSRFSQREPYEAALPENRDEFKEAMDMYNKLTVEDIEKILMINKQNKITKKENIVR